MTVEQLIGQLGKWDPTMNVYVLTNHESPPDCNEITAMFKLDSDSLLLGRLEDIGLAVEALQP